MSDETRRAIAARIIGWALYAVAGWCAIAAAAQTSAQAALLMAAGIFGVAAVIVALGHLGTNA